MCSSDLVDTVREPDGLALSSRNVRLSSDERAQAPVIHRALSLAREALLSGAGADTARAVFTSEIAAAPSARVEDVSVAHPESLSELTGQVDAAVVSCAVWFGDVRLIDNVLVP